MIDYLKEFISGSLDLEFEQRSNTAEKLSKRVKRLEVKKIKAKKAAAQKSNENLKRFF